MKKEVRLNEEGLRQLIEQVLTEKFDNDNLAAMIRGHGGLRNLPYMDIRNNSTFISPQKAEPKEYLSKEFVDTLMKLNWHQPINKQLLLTNDGGAILVQDRADYDYNDKIHTRIQKFRKANTDNEEIQNVGVDYANYLRKDAHDTANKRK